MGAGLVEGLASLVEPTLRLGVTGLSRSGKTVFTTALVRALSRGAPLPLLTARREGRLIAARASEQPDPDVPAFLADDHAALMTADPPAWPPSTTRLSELRLILDYRSTSWLGRLTGNSRLTLDIVDYPGEWLLDLGLIGKDYETWARETIELAREPRRRDIAQGFLAETRALDPAARADETAARRAAAVFTAYLRAARSGPLALSTLPPGRFLLPGDMEGSPALTFAPLDLAPDARPAPGSAHEMMAKRYDAYVALVVRPFFRDHFSRLDRQIVLVDALTAIDAGPQAVGDLERALDGTLSAFRTGPRSAWTGWLSPRIDRVLFAATKADHLSEVDHPRLAAILKRLVERAGARVEASGALMRTAALAAVRATREAEIEIDGETLPAIMGTPLAGQRLGGETYDGRTAVALFPGDLPVDPDAVFRPGFSGADEAARAVRYLRFAPPPTDADGHLPHIGLDSALEFLIGDRLA